jgi:hypothetical protein
LNVAAKNRDKEEKWNLEKEERRWRLISII